MIAEDDRALRQMLCWEFEEMGYRVITAASCGDAISAVGDHKVDIALIDYNLPDGVGTDLLRTLRLAAPYLPAVVCSGRASRGIAAEVGGLGTARFVAKPVAATRLHAIFRNLLD
ncbi:MAG: response regulator [Chromatiaceae bacterium]|nr:response regulator [Gammaproteobacteria bacterium]MCP5428149.1 response regulator [Chromatiaceae bacterium]MCB1862598.1 response regulator [Gammaproteobacteria bacterium]MCB1872662.1 response regulator [Gammaproteobacteria bacterium]MCB1880324.1 response regulator [Gammaproteobacteria bacterium]